ncbi:MAG: RNA-binding protein, partial [Gammaproteobacteria bacterium]|nr:RNA-binding protein [Gammaproteobacteria bacterium]
MSATTHYRSKILMGDMSAYQWFMTHAWPRQLMRNALYLNSGTGRFLEIAHLAGLASSDWTWAVQLADLDNDGWVDAFFTNGAPRDDMNPDYMQRAREEGSRSGPAAFGEVLKSIPSAADANLAFRNDGDLHFEDVSVSWGVDHTGVSFGACVSDLDGDGDLDLVVNNMNEPASIYRNDGDPKHRVVIRLRGAGANTHGVGALVHVQTASTKQQRRLL